MARNVPASAPARARRRRQPSGTCADTGNRVKLDGLGASGDHRSRQFARARMVGTGHRVGRRPRRTMEQPQDSFGEVDHPPVRGDCLQIDMQSPIGSRRRHGHVHDRRAGDDDGTRRRFPRPDDAAAVGISAICVVHRCLTRLGLPAVGLGTRRGLGIHPISNFAAWSGWAARVPSAVSHSRLPLTPAGGQMLVVRHSSEPTVRYVSERPVRGQLRLPAVPPATLPGRHAAPPLTAEPAGRARSGRATHRTARHGSRRR